MLWHEQTWPTIQKLDRNLPVVIPLGSCEQHGHHLPLLVDTLQVAAIARNVNSELKEAVLVLPELWLGSSHHHADFPGTISVLPSLYSEMIKSIATCILRAGFKRLLFLNGHGGNVTPASQALSELVCGSDLADDAYLLLSSWWEIARPEILPEKLGMTTPRISHACEYETSLMLAVRPDLVVMNAIRQGTPVLDNDWIATENERGNRVAMFRRFRRLTAAGSLGNPSAATAEKGQLLLSVVSREVVALIRDLSTWKPLAPLGPA